MITTIGMRERQSVNMSNRPFIDLNGCIFHALLTNLVYIQDMLSTPEYVPIRQPGVSLRKGRFKSANQEAVGILALNGLVSVEM